MGIFASISASENPWLLVIQTELPAPTLEIAQTIPLGFFFFAYLSSEFKRFVLRAKSLLKMTFKCFWHFMTRFRFFVLRCIAILLPWLKQSKRRLYMENQFTFTGTLTGLEVKTSKAGKQFATFTLATQEEGYQGAKKDLFVKMTAFGKTAESVIKTGEGSTIAVSGKIDSREWQGKHYIDLKAITVLVVDSGDVL